MDRADIVARLTGILRERLLHGSDRPLDQNVPLTELGLDSLGVVEFMAAVESAYDRELPDSFWSRPGLRLVDFLDFLEQPDTGGERRRP